MKARRRKTSPAELWSDPGARERPGGGLHHWLKAAIKFKEVSDVPLTAEVGGQWLEDSYQAEERKCFSSQPGT